VETKSIKKIPNFSFLPGLAILGNIIALADFCFIKSTYFLAGYLSLSLSIFFLLIYIFLNLYYKKNSKDSLNFRVSNLRGNALDPALLKTEDTQHEYAIDLWMKSLAKENDLKLFSEHFFRFLSKEFELAQGILFLKNAENKVFKPISTYAYFNDDSPSEFEEGEGLHGQVAKLHKHISITEIPENHIKIISGLGETTPGQLLIIPLIAEKDCIGILELAFFKAHKDINIQQMLQMSNQLTVGIRERKILTERE